MEDSDDNDATNSPYTTHDSRGGGDDDRSSIRRRHLINAIAITILIVSLVLLVIMLFKKLRADRKSSKKAMWMTGSVSSTSKTDPISIRFKGERGPQLKRPSAAKLPGVPCPAVEYSTLPEWLKKK